MSTSPLSIHKLPKPASDRCSSDVSGALQSVRQCIIRLIDDEDGTTAVEYAVMVGMIAVACIVSVNLMASAAKESFQNSATAIGE